MYIYLDIDMCIERERKQISMNMYVQMYMCIEMYMYIQTYMYK